MSTTTARAQLVMGLATLALTGLAGPPAASAETLFALTFPLQMPYWTSPPAIYGKDPVGYIDYGMRLCAVSGIITANNLKFRQLIIANGQKLYIDTSEGYPGGVPDPANDKKCQTNAGLYAQQSNPRYAQVFGSAAQSASPLPNVGGTVTADSSSSPAAPPPALDDPYKNLRVGDWKSAFLLVKPLAEQGDATAQFDLGFMYENGKGVPQDYAEATKWYRKAAAQGNAEAIRIIAGGGGHVDTKAPAQGNANTQNNLRDMSTVEIGRAHV